MIIGDHGATLALLLWLDVHANQSLLSLFALPLEVDKLNGFGVPRLQVLLRFLKFRSDQIH
jgi:hypothetical protein